MPLCHFRRQYEQQSQFEKGRIIGMMEAGGQLNEGGVMTSGSEKCHLYENQAQDAFDGPFVEKTATSGNCDFSNHTKAPGERTFGIAAPITCAVLYAHPSTPPFGGVPRTRALQRYTAPTAGLMAWGAIAYNTRLPLVLICGSSVICP
ncbi:transposable element Tcb1 transposase [Trichonephila clavipes]|nr:transposable element Tcb1 transposase [Trichonephila clavipes]